MPNDPARYYAARDRPRIREAGGYVRDDVDGEMVACPSCGAVFTPPAKESAAEESTTGAPAAEPSGPAAAAAPADDVPELPTLPAFFPGSVGVMHRLRKFQRLRAGFVRATMPTSRPRSLDAIAREVYGARDGLELISNSPRGAA